MAPGRSESAQLLELFEKAMRASERVEENEANEAEETRCVDALKALRTMPVTTSILMETQVGKRLRKLTKHNSTRICSFAQELIDAWKKIVADEAAVKNSSNGSGTKKPSAKEIPKSPGLKSPGLLSPGLQSPSTKSAVAFKPVAKIETVSVTVKTTTKAESRVENKSSVTVVTNGSSAKVPTPLRNVTKSGNPVRDKIRELLVDAFSKVLTEAEDEDLQKAKAQNIIKAAVNVESALFKDLGLSTSAVNKGRYRSIMFNIKDEKNPDLRRRLLSGEIAPEKLATLSVEDMASDWRKEQNEIIKAKALFECERGLKAAASTDQFKCSKCKQRQCTYFQMQTRSADEPMTTFVTCVNCNNHWKFC